MLIFSSEITKRFIFSKYKPDKVSLQIPFRWNIGGDLKSTCSKRIIKK